MMDRFLGDAFGDFVLPVLECCSAVWCSAAVTHLKLLDRAVSGARFLTGGVFECDISPELCALISKTSGARASVSDLSTCGASAGSIYTLILPQHLFL